MLCGGVHCMNTAVLCTINCIVANVFGKDTACQETVKQSENMMNVQEIYVDTIYH